jgi:prepilin-type N-terminal cleavage/methylation domain-containing protein
MKSHGYSLIELMVCAAIMGTLAASAVPPVLSIHRVWKFQNEASRVVHTLEQTRLRAILTNASFRFTASGGEYSISQSGGDVRSFPLADNLQFGGPRKTVLFSSRGTASPAGTLKLVQGSSEISIVISPTGRVRTIP